MRMRVLQMAGLLAASACGPSDRTEGPPDELDIDTTQLGLIDCTPRTDTGYVSGSPFAIEVVTVDGKPAERDTANAYWLMQQAAAADGVQIAIVSGFRTMAEQQYLYDCYVNCSCNSCNLAARPGYSNHQSGHALDLNASAPGVLAWLNANGAAFGFERTVPSENWHWEWWGGGPGGGPCLGCNLSCDGTILTALDCSTEDCALGEGTCVDDGLGVRCEPRCDALPSEGGVIEEAGSCFTAFGPGQFWRSVEGEGHGGGLIWTNAFENDEPSNWGRWAVDPAEAGEYDVAVYLEPAYAVYADTRYEVRHDDGGTVVTIDQSLGGWVSLGVYTFSPGEEHSVSIYDNATSPISPDQHIAVDAVRLERVSRPEQPPRFDPVRLGQSLPALEHREEPGVQDPKTPPKVVRPSGVSRIELTGGCTCLGSSARPSGFGLITIMLGGLFFRRRRAANH